MMTRLDWTLFFRTFERVRLVAPPFAARKKGADEEFDLLPERRFRPYRASLLISLDTLLLVFT